MIARTEKGPAPFSADAHAFLASVVYAAVFDYPLTIDQLHESLIGVHATARDVAEWYDASPELQAVVEFHDGYYFPHGRRDLLELRDKREAISRGVLREMRRPLGTVLRMPFVRMVALSGSLAHLNAEGEADLDLFVITQGGRVWGVTTTLLLLSRVFGWRKRLCLNYVISERQLAVEPADLFSANQIVHLRPLCGEACYRRFLEANRFVTELYPNFAPRAVSKDGGAFLSAVASAKAEAPPAIRRAIEWLLDHTIAPLYERLCRAAYRRYLQRRAHTWQSREHVRLEPECLKLHTSSHRQAVLDRFERALAEAERVRPGEAVRARVAR